MSEQPVRAVPLPFSARCLAAVGMRWPLTKGTSRFVSLMRMLLRGHTGYSVVTLKTNGRDASIAIPFPDDASFSIAALGEQDPSLFSLLSKLCRSGGVFIDIGANLGVYALRMSLLPDVHSIAFEPQSELCNLLRVNAGLLGVSDRLEIHSVALGEHAGIAYLEQCEWDRGRTRVLYSDAATQSGKIVPVAVETLDMLLPSIGTRPIAAIKLDAEGFEPHILRGARELLRRYHPPVVVELNRLEHKHSSEEILPFLREAGYAHLFVIDRKIYPVDSGGLPICNILALTEASPVLEWLDIDPNYLPASTSKWSLTHF